MNSLDEAFRDFSDDRGLTPDELVREKRSFMAGALACLTLATRRMATPEALRAELIGFGRTVGTPLERAT